MNELSIQNPNGSVVVAEDYKAIAIEYLKGMGMNLPTKYANQFLEVCKAYNLNPFKRECYAVGYGDNWNIITGYEVYIKRAERTGKLDGWECHVEGSNDNELRAVITIYRKDWSHPFTHIVYFNEAVQKKKDGSVNTMWFKMKTFMLRKVCIAQGFRLCFPDELGGMPYTSDELPEIEKVERNVTPTTEYVENNESKASRPVEEENRRKLKQIIETYEVQLSGTPYELSCEALAENDPMKISEMLGRCTVYLGKKGIKVA